MGRNKYPRTLHLPWSPGRTADDLVLEETQFDGREVVILEKVDGENTTMTTNHCHARSPDSRDHPSRHRLKALHASIAYDIPIKMRVCGENAFAKHSIFYDCLPGFFLVFGIFDDDREIALSWEEVAEWSALLGLPTVPVLWQGTWNEKLVRDASFWKPQLGPESEGYVVRLADRFATTAFSRSVAKFVRHNHVQTSKHWRRQRIEPNQLA